MGRGHWPLRATRRRIIELLRAEPLTVSALAERLDLTASAVRVHMSALEHQGLVRRTGATRGRSRPAAIYELAPGIDELLCGAYVPFLANLVQTLGEESSDDELARFMHAAGRRLARQHGSAAGTVHERAEAASTLLNELGALTAVESTPERLAIVGVDCPLAAAVQGSPKVCQALESFVAEMVRSPVRECCERQGRPRCCFIIDVEVAGGAGRSSRSV